VFVFLLRLRISLFLVTEVILFLGICFRFFLAIVVELNGTQRCAVTNCFLILLVRVEAVVNFMVPRDN